MRRHDPTVHASRTHTQWGRRVWLPLGRLVVVAATALAIVFFVTGLRSYFDYITTVCRTATCGNGQLPVRAVSHLAALGISLGVYAVYIIALQCLYVLATLAVALLLLWRRPNDGFALFTALTLVVWIFFVVDVPTPLANGNAAWGLVNVLFSLARFPCFTLFFLAFPSGRFASAWARWLVFGFATLLAVAFAVAANGGKTSPVIYLAIFIVWFGVLIFVQVNRYRNVSTEVRRQQTKWVVFGLVVALLGFMLVLAVQIATGGFESNPFSGLLNGLYVLFELWVPLSIGVAILHSRLYDIDLLINRTLVYGSLTAVLVAIYLIGVVGTQAVVQAITGQATGNSPLAIVVTTLLIAALFQPLRRRMQGTIDRRFYRSRYDVSRMIADFGSTLRSEVNLDALTGELVATVEEAMQPAQVSIWLRAELSNSGSRSQEVS